MLLLDGKTVLISGIGPGMGRALALAAAREGADVVLTARSAERLEAVAAEVRQAGRRAVAVPGDVARDEDCVRIVETAVRALGAVDVLINNAFQQPPFELLAEQPLATVRAGLDINLLAALRLSQLVVPGMAARGGGAIVMVNSAILREPKERMGAYKMAKHGLLGMAQALALELGPQQIRVNTVAPCYIRGEALLDYFRAVADATGSTAEAVEAGVASEAALGRIPRPEEVAEAAIFLASSRASAVTGACLDVNCGMHFTA